MRSRADERRHAIPIAVLGTALVIAYALLAVAQILWLNPQAAVPGVPLKQIWQDVAMANESMSAPFVIGVMVLGPVMAMTVLFKAVIRADMNPLAMVTGYLAILMFGSIAYFVASFGPGMALADTYGIDGWNYAPWALPLYVLSGVALLALIGITVAARHFRHTTQSWTFSETYPWASLMPRSV